MAYFFMQKQSRRRLRFQFDGANAMWVSTSSESTWVYTILKELSSFSSIFSKFCQIASSQFTRNLIPRCKTPHPLSPSRIIKILKRYISKVENKTEITQKPHYFIWPENAWLSETPKQTEKNIFWFRETNRKTTETDWVSICFGSNRKFFLIISQGILVTLLFFVIGMSLPLYLYS